MGSQKRHRKLISRNKEVVGRKTRFPGEGMGVIRDRRKKGEGAHREQKEVLAL